MKKKFEAFLTKIRMRKCTLESIKYEGKLLFLVYSKILLIYFLFNFFMESGWDELVGKIVIIFGVIIIGLILYSLFRVIKIGRLHCCVPDFNKIDSDDSPRECQHDK